MVIERQRPRQIIVHGVPVLLCVSETWSTPRGRRRRRIPLLCTRKSLRVTLAPLGVYPFITQEQQGNIFPCSVRGSRRRRRRSPYSNARWGHQHNSCSGLCPSRCLSFDSLVQQRTQDASFIEGRDKQSIPKPIHCHGISVSNYESHLLELHQQWRRGHFDDKKG